MKRRRLDSDDDEDEYLQSLDAPLNRYADGGDVRDLALEMGFASSSSTSRASSAPRETMAAPGEDTARRDGSSHGEGGDRHDDKSAVARPRLVRLSSQTRSDADVPDGLCGLLSDALLTVYQLPLVRLQSTRPVDDRLLSQYLPLDKERAKGALKRVPYPKSVFEDADTDDDDEEERDGAEEAPSGVGARHTYKSPYGIPPGWRWDGVARGRQHS